MKQTEKPTETQQKVLDFLGKFEEAHVDMIAKVTQLNKLIVFKTVKTLVDKNLIKLSGDDPAIYKLLKPEEKTNKEVDKKISKAEKIKVDDEVSLKNESGRDTSKLKFNGELYGKGRLVLAVVKKYMEDNPKTTFTKLKEIFPDELQKRYGLLQEVSKAKKLSADRERFFLKPEDLIKVGDKKVAVCNQFGSNNIDSPIKHFKTLGYIVK